MRQLLHESPYPLKGWEQSWHNLADDPVVVSRDTVRPYDSPPGEPVIKVDARETRFDGMQSAQTPVKPEKKLSHSSHFLIRAPLLRQLLQVSP